MVSPAHRRQAANYLVRRFKVSQRRARKVVGQNRSTQRYTPVVPEQEALLVKAMNELAAKHPRWGYRSVAQLLRNQGWAVNVKRVERLWRLEGHRLAPTRLKDSGQKARGVGENSSLRRPAARPNHIWTYDFVSARVRRGGAIRILNVLDEFTRVSLGSKVSRSIGAEAVVAHLSKLFETHGKPLAIRSDNGREFIASSVVDWLDNQGVEAVFIEKASPQQNPFIERFNGTMRRDLLNVEEINSITEAQVLVNNFNLEYNEVRPHRSLHMMTPHAFSQSHKVRAR
jgi:transposase InsO family protein